MIKCLAISALDNVSSFELSDNLCTLFTGTGRIKCGNSKSATAIVTLLGVTEIFYIIFVSLINN